MPSIAASIPGNPSARVRAYSTMGEWCGVMQDWAAAADRGPQPKAGIPSVKVVREEGQPLGPSFGASDKKNGKADGVAHECDAGLKDVRDGRKNLNLATESELMNVPQIGRVLSVRIVQSMPILFQIYFQRLANFQSMFYIDPSELVPAATEFEIA